MKESRGDLIREKERVIEKGKRTKQVVDSKQQCQIVFEKTFMEVLTFMFLQAEVVLSKEDRCTYTFSSSDVH